MATRAVERNTALGGTATASGSQKPVAPTGAAIAAALSAIAAASGPDPGSIYQPGKSSAVPSAQSRIESTGGHTRSQLSFAYATATAHHVEPPAADAESEDLGMHAQRFGWIGHALAGGYGGSQLHSEQLCGCIAARGALHPDHSGQGAQDTGNAKSPAV